MFNFREMAPLPKPTPEGYRIILYRLKDTDPSKLLFNDLVKCFCAFNDAKISEDGLVPGYIVLLDMKGVSFSHFMKVTPYVQSIRCILLYLQVNIKLMKNLFLMYIQLPINNSLLLSLGMPSSSFEASSYHKYCLIYGSGALID